MKNALRPTGQLDTAAPSAYRDTNNFVSCTQRKLTSYKGLALTAAFAFFAASALAQTSIEAPGATSSPAVVPGVLLPCFVGIKDRHMNVQTKRDTACQPGAPMNIARGNANTYVIGQVCDYQKPIVRTGGKGGDLDYEMVHCTYVGAIRDPSDLYMKTQMTATP